MSSSGNKIRHVFNFTCGQMLKKKGYKVATILIGLFIFAGIFLIVMLGAKKKDNTEEELTKTGKLVVCNESDIVCYNPDDVVAAHSPMKAEDISTAVAEALAYKEITVEWKDNASAAELCKAENEKNAESDTMFAVIRKTDEGYGIYMVRPTDCSFSEGDATDAGYAMIPVLQTYVERKIDPNMAQFIKLESVPSTIVVGEDTSLVAELVKYLLPMLSGMLMYFMIMIYGQDVARNVAAEKTSKLMETMLSFVKPKDLIFGKILAGFVMSVAQVLIWVACGFGGYWVGTLAAKAINPDYTDYVSKAFNAIRAVTGESAMTFVPIVQTLLVFFLGLLLYYAVAGIGGSIVTKPEEVAQANTVIVFPVLIFWMVGYLAAASQNEAVLTICRYIPFAAPFTVTAEILVGKVSVWVGLIVVAEMIAATLLLVWIAGRIYRGLVLYNGEKLSVKKVFGIIRGK
ncbi:MAG: ABC transporter permease [Lachnospiraceae bacterium]|nr:ABC transporter permease [Lachnospiraceae bacterium]